MSTNGMRVYTLENWCKQLGDQISIPKIQRGFVWKPQQIAGLWDSLLRGFPIGSFMIQPSAKGGDAVELIDGQQRGKSIAGGVNFKLENGFKVWIACRVNSSNPEFQFDIKVTTDKHPFGFDNKFKSLSVSQRSKAFKTSICQKYIPQEKNITEKSLEEIFKLIEVNHAKSEINVSLEDTIPYSPSIKYVGLDELFKAVHATKGNTSEAIVAIKKIFQCNDNLESTQDDFLQKLVNALEALLNGRVFYAIEVENKLYEKNKNKNNNDNNNNNNNNNNKDFDLEVLFKRVGTGGTNLSDLDFAYSLIKSRLDKSKEYIDSLLMHSSISSFFSALDCVDLLIRTSCFEVYLRKASNVIDASNKKEVMGEDKDYAKNTKKIIYNRIDANKEIIKSMFNTLGNTIELKGSSKLKDCLLKVVQSLEYNAEFNANGIPLQLLNKLPKKIWQMFIILTYSGVLDEKNVSAPFTRIALYWLLISPNSEETAKIVYAFIQLIKDSITNNKESSFDFEYELISLIHKTSRKNNTSFARLLSQSTFEKLTISTCDLLAPTKTVDAKYKLDIDDKYLMGKLFWKNKRLLLWLQRHYIHKLNSAIELKILDGITLYDFDHIIPQHFWSGTSNVAKSFKNEGFGYDSHWAVGDSIGNFQLLKFSDNRAKSSAAYNVWMESLKHAKKDVIKDAVLAKSDKYFSQTCASKEWNKEQRLSFVKAVEVRTCDLYAELLSIYDEHLIYFEKEINTTI